VTAVKDAFDVLVVGGGTTGLALASALADALEPAGQVGVVDPAAGDGALAHQDVRASAISAASKRLLDVLGVWAPLAPHAGPVAAVDITDAALGDVFRPVLVSYDNAVEGGEPATYIVENERLHAAVRDGAARRTGVVRIGGTVAAWRADAGGGVVTLADGRMLRAPLVVAADGRGSRPRSRTAPVPSSTSCPPARSPSCPSRMTDRATAPVSPGPRTNTGAGPSSSSTMRPSWRRSRSASATGWAR
jgi:2-octaprenyl-6-methoxyphenol hydroxylase